MHIILHAGVQCTDDGRLLKTLLRNKETLAKARVAIPHPKSYRTLLDKMLTNKNNPITGGNFLAIILKDTIIQSFTVILSNPLFFGSSKEVLGPQQIYPNAVKLTEQFLHLFAEDNVNLYFSIRNPASFLPAIFENSKLLDFSAFLKIKILLKSGGLSLPQGCAKPSPIFLSIYGAISIALLYGVKSYAKWVSYLRRKI